MGRLGSLLWDTTHGLSRRNADAGVLLACIDCGVLRPASVTRRPCSHPTPSIPLQTSTGCPQKRCWAAALQRSPFVCWRCCPSFRCPSSVSECSSCCGLHGVPCQLLAAAAAGGRACRRQVARAASCYRPCRQQCPTNNAASTGLALHKLPEQVSSPPSTYATTLQRSYNTPLIARSLGWFAWLSA